MLIRMRNATQAVPLRARALLLWLSVRLETGVCGVNAPSVKDYCWGSHPTMPPAPTTRFVWFLVFFFSPGRLCRNQVAAKT